MQKSWLNNITNIFGLRINLEMTVIQKINNKSEKEGKACQISENKMVSHVERMPKHLLHGHVIGVRKKGRLRKRWLKDVKIWEERG